MSGMTDPAPGRTLPEDPAGGLKHHHLPRPEIFPWRRPPDSDKTCSEPMVAGERVGSDRR